MNQNQKQFFEMLSRYPRIQQHWSQGSKSLAVDSFEHDLGVMSHGEAHIARFFAAVWFGENRYNFDLIDAASILELPARQMIMAWVERPFYP